MYYIFIGNCGKFKKESLNLNYYKADEHFKVIGWLFWLKIQLSLINH